MSDSRMHQTIHRSKFPKKACESPFFQRSTSQEKGKFSTMLTGVKLMWRRQCSNIRCFNASSSTSADFRLLIRRTVNGK